MYTCFDIEVMYLLILFFKVLMNLSATDFEYISIAFFSSHDFIDLL